MSGLTNILGSASAIAGVAAAVSSSAVAIASWVAVRAQTRQLDEVSEQSALQSTDIQVLGSYLYENVGNARISSYVRDDELRGRVTRALEAITSFLGPEPTSRPESQAPAPPAVPPELVSQTVSAEMDKALQDVRFGEVWNGLARIRRIIEIRLREISPEIPENRPISAGRILTSLAKAGRIPDEAVSLLRYAIDVSNAGVHGQEVDAGQAEEAWRCALQGLAMLGPGADTPAPPGGQS